MILFSSESRKNYCIRQTKMIGSRPSQNFEPEKLNCPPQDLTVGIERCAVPARVQQRERMEPRCPIWPKVFRACTAR
jgi:hypothetical protein